MRIDNDSHYIIRLIVLLTALIGLNSCSDPIEGDRPLVVATTGIIGDVVGRVGGEEIELITLIPAGVDPHDYFPSAQQVAAISEAELIFANGLGLEEGLLDLLEQAESEGLRVEFLAERVDPIEEDPHFWQDPVRMMTATALIATAMVELGIDGAEANADVFETEIADLHQEIEALINQIPAEKRLLITNHDAFDYFATRYGLEVIGTVIPGGSTQGSPSSAELATLVGLIEAHSIPAIFVENTGSSDLAETLAAEIGRPVAVVELASDALGEPGSDTATYLDLIRFNARAIATALAG